jgi:signal transduction histidine kinase
MEKVNDTGDYSQSIPDSGKDEIGTLIKVFNSLLRHVKENETRKDEFIGIASHELKTPLTSIKGYLELLNTIETKQPNKQLVEKAFSNAGKLDKLIKDLLDVSKMQIGQLELNLSTFDIDELIDETVASFQMVAKTHTISVTHYTDHQFIRADRQRVEQVLINLLSNAVKYSSDESQVLVSLRRQDGEVVVGIRDFGQGVPKGEETNIFERFYRTKNVSKHISGFGLGLYICRDIIQRHKGIIWVESEEKGSLFCFSLPLEASQPESHL